MSDSDEVGYGKPPKHSQFKKGVSGNKKGRPKGQGSIKGHVMLEKVLSKEITIVEKGKRVTITMLDALEQRLITDAINGDKRALALCFGLMTKLPYLKPEKAPPPVNVIKKILDDIAAKGPPRLPLISRPEPQKTEINPVVPQEIKPDIRPPSVLPGPKPLTVPPLAKMKPPDS